MLSSFLNIDVMIVVGYLLLTLYIGIKSSKKITTFKEYAIGSGNFTIPVLTATLLATLLGTENLMGLSESVYSEGIIWILLFFGNSFRYILIANYISPRIHHYHGTLSAADIMGKMYTNKSRIVTAIVGTISSVGGIAAQIVAIGYLSQEFLGINAIVGIVVSASVIVIYSSMGGINAVAYTDVLQFIFLMVAVPVVSYFVFSKAGGVEGITQLMSLPKYNSHFSIVSEKYSIWAVISLLVLFYVPGMSPATAQRLLMADGDTKKAVKSMQATSFIGLPFHFMVGIIGLSAIILFPGIQADLVFPTVVKQLLPVGVKGLAIAGILAVAMSTADSYLNVAAVFITNDIIKPLKPNVSDKILLSSTQLITFILGIAAITVAIYFNNIIDIILTFEGFWAAIVEIPLIFGILKFRASSKTFIRAAITGGSIHIIWLLFSLENITGFPSFGPAILSNAIVFFTSRYFERADYPNEKIMIEKQISTPLFTTGFPRTLSEFANIVRNSVSENAQYVTFGVFIIATYIVPIFMWSQVESPGQEYGVSIYLRIIAGILCSLMILSDKGKEKFANYLPFYWLFTICFCLPFSTTFMFLENHGSPMWLVNMTISVFLLSTITNWVSFILLNAVGITAGYYFYIYIYGAENLMHFTYHELYMMIYIVAFSSLVGFIFTRNKEYIQQRFRSILQKQVDEKTIEIRQKNVRLEDYAAEVVKKNKTLEQNAVEIEQKNIRLEDYAMEVDKINKELRQALSVKERFLNNLSHEVRTPLQNLYSKTSIIFDMWDQLDEEKKREELAVIKENNEGLYKYVSGILDIASIDSGQINVQMKDEIETREMIENAVARIEDQAKHKHIEIVKDIEDITLYNVDKIKLEQVVYHVLDNAVRYSEREGMVELRGMREENNYIISIKDEGIGVPLGEEERIFEAFEESSRTKTSAQGKGLGLALARGIVERHRGKIWCKSNEGGSIFYISLPITDKRGKKTDTKNIDLSDKNIVIIDDSKSVLISFELIMMSIGCGYKLFENAVDALEYTRNNKVDMIFTDYMMEPMNGIEFASRLREFNKIVPVILQSGVIGEDGYAEKMESAGISTFLAKPHTPDLIKQTILALL